MGSFSMKTGRTESARLAVLFMTLVVLNTLAGVEVDIFIPSFPQLQAHFGLTPFWVQFTLSLNFVAYALSSLFMGVLGDRLCRRKVILISLVLFNVGSVLCVFTPSFVFMLLGRVLQGAGIAGCSTLGFVVITDEFPAEKQPGLLGIFNGITTISMAAAPVIGSYVNLCFGWRANFTVLLGLGLVGLLASWIFLPRSKAVMEPLPISWHIYTPLLRSKPYMRLMIAVVMICCAYWIFIGMAPILYMDGLGVPLREFGFYQGAIVLPFAIVSLLSPKLMAWMGHQRSYRVGLILVILGMLCMIALLVTGYSNPKAITATMMIVAMGLVFPINLLYPASLFIVEGAKGRAAAALNAVRLVYTAVALEAVSYVYDGSYTPLGITIVASLAIFLALVITYKPMPLGAEGAQMGH